MNSISIISSYKYLDIGVFDDPRVGLVQEPFVSGVNNMIDRVVADIPNAETGFIMLFSATPFPGHQLALEWQRAESGGNWYHAPQLGMDGFVLPCSNILRKRPSNCLFK